MSEGWDGGPMEEDLSPDEWERSGGGTNKPERAADPGFTTERLLLRGVLALERIAASHERLTEMVRGRDGKGDTAKSVLTAIYGAIQKPADKSVQRQEQPRQQQAQQRPAVPAQSGGPVAGPADLDSQYGNPVVKFDPRDWAGGSYIGCQYSACEPEYLDMMAAALQWSAEHPKDDRQAKYAANNRKDAARARGWAQRLRGGYAPPPPKSPEDVEIPL